MFLVTGVSPSNNNNNNNNDIYIFTLTSIRDKNDSANLCTGKKAWNSLSRLFRLGFETWQAGKFFPKKLSGSNFFYYLYHEFCFLVVFCFVVVGSVLDSVTVFYVSHFLKWLAFSCLLFFYEPHIFIHLVYATFWRLPKNVDLGSETQKSVSRQYRELKSRL